MHKFFQTTQEVKAMPIITKGGCIPFYYASTAGDWWADTTTTDVLVDGYSFVVGFKTYTHSDELVKNGSIELYIGPSKNGKAGYIGLYLAKDRELPIGYELKQ